MPAHDRPVSLLTVNTDLRELTNGMEVVRNALAAMPDNRVLADFIAENSEVVAKAEADVAQMLQLYAQTASYFGEDSAVMEPSEFFSHIVRFINAFREADRENEALAKAQHDAAAPKPAAAGSRAAGAGVGADADADADAADEANAADAADADHEDGQPPMKKLETVADGTIDELIRQNKFKSFHQRRNVRLKPSG